MASHPHCMEFATEKLSIKEEVEQIDEPRVGGVVEEMGRTWNKCRVRTSEVL